jgi:hypothetical protein
VQHFLVISLLIYSTPVAAQSRFHKRVLETVLGVAVAVMFGVAISPLPRRAASILRPYAPGVPPET